MAEADDQRDGGKQGSGSASRGGDGQNRPPPPPPPAPFPVYGIVIIALVAVILIVVVIILIVYIRRRKRRQTGDVEKSRGKQPQKENHGKHGKPNEKSRIVKPMSQGEIRKKTVKDERIVHNEPPQDKRVGREKSVPTAPQVKKSAQPASEKSGDSYIDMTQQSSKQAKPLPQKPPLPTYDNRPPNQNVYDKLDPMESYQGLQSEYLEPTPQSGETYQSLNSDRRDYVNEETGSYLELQPPGYEDPVSSSQLVAHYMDLK